MNKKKIKKIKVSSFDKSYKKIISTVAPANLIDIETCSSNSKKLITMGSNYSYAPAPLGSKSLSIKMLNFNKILNFNIKKKEITVQAGIKLYELLNFTLKFNLWIPQLPGYPFITIGGAVAANVHGKSSGFYGTIRNSIKELLIFHKEKGWINLSLYKNRDLFELTIGGLGLTGTIVSVTLKLENFNYINFLTKRYEVKNITETINYLKQYRDTQDLYLYSWNDASNFNNFGRGFVFASKPIDKSKKKKIFLEFKQNYKSTLPLWNRYSSTFFNTVFYYFQKNRKTEYKENFKKTIFPFAEKERYFHFYGNKGFIESQLIIKFSLIDDFFEEFIKYYKSFNPEIILFSFKNISGKQKYLRFENEGICVTFDFTKKKKNIDFLKKIDELCVRFEIIPSIIKDSRIQKKIFDKCYQEADLFREKLLKFDKNRIYQSEISRRLKI